MKLDTLNVMGKNSIFQRKTPQFSKITSFLVDCLHVMHWSLVRVQQIGINPYYQPLLFQILAPAGPLLGLEKV